MTIVVSKVCYKCGYDLRQFMVVRNNEHLVEHISSNNPMVGIVCDKVFMQYGRKLASVWQSLIPLMKL